LIKQLMAPNLNQSLTRATTFIPLSPQASIWKRDRRQLLDGIFDWDRRNFNLRCRERLSTAERNGLTFFCTDCIVSFPTNYPTMKFVLACSTLALTASLAGAFAPSKAFARSTARSMSAVETPTFTFTKSEEIFAEAQNVSTVPVMAYAYEYSSVG
jgi:hypothetical protein